MAWMVIETWLFHEWRRVVDTSSTSKAHRSRLNDGRTWTAAVISETLRMLNVIDAAQLQRITEYRNKRNAVIHSSHKPKSGEAEAVVVFAEELTHASLLACGVKV
jgi:hypothetical protein